MRYLYRKWTRRIKRLLIKHSFIPQIGEMGCDFDFIYYQPAIYEIKTELTFSLTGEDIDHILRKALEGGIIRWCKEVTADGHWPGKFVSEQLSRGGTLFLHDMDGRVHELTLPKLLEGFRLFIVNGGNVDRTAKGQIDIRDIGRAEADAIIQYALFGKRNYD